MDATIGIYNNHDLAVGAVKVLKDSGYPVSQLSIVGIAETEVIDNEMHIMPKNPLKVKGLGAGALIGATIGLFTGIGVFTIPGLGLLYGAGALVGTIAGIDFGLIGGGVASVIATLGITDSNVQLYHDALQEGKFLVVVHGKDDEINKAKAILVQHNTHNELS